MNSRLYAEVLLLALYRLLLHVRRAGRLQPDTARLAHNIFKELGAIWASAEEQRIAREAAEAKDFAYRTKTVSLEEEPEAVREQRRVHKLFPTFAAEFVDFLPPAEQQTLAEQVKVQADRPKRPARLDELDVQRLFRTHGLLFGSAPLPPSEAEQELFDHCLHAAFTVFDEVPSSPSPSLPSFPFELSYPAPCLPTSHLPP